MRCAKHGIAAGPDGRCVVCRRAAAPDAASGSRRLISLGVLGLALVTVALVFARPLRVVSAPAVSVAPPASVVAEAPKPEHAAKPEPAADPLPAAYEPTLPHAAAPSSDVPAEPELAASAPAPAVSASAAATTPSPSASPARPSEAALVSAIRATPIVMFSTGWCGVCTRARAFLNANGLRYSDRDIDHDNNARDELKRRTGKTSIPTIEVDGQLLTPGFSEQKVMAAVARSVQRRLGVGEIEIRFRQ